jgi:putative DNA primase/helicase
MNARFAVTFFANQGAQQKREESLTRETLAERIRSATAPEKARLPWLKLARFGNAQTAKGSLRHDHNVITCTGIEADYDDEETSFNDAVEILLKANVDAIVYTSPSHTDERPRWRVLCPFSTELPPNRRSHMLGRLNGLFRGVFAAESWTLSQAFYFGAVNGNPAHRVEIVEGIQIDKLDELDEIWLGKPDTIAKRGNGGGNNFDSGRVHEDALLAAIVNGESYHISCTRLVGKWAQQGVPVLDARKRLLDAFEQVDSFGRDARWQQRRDDLTRIIRDIYGKEAERRDAGGGAPAELVDVAKPLIRVIPGRRHEAADAGLAALSAAGVEFYQRDRSLVRCCVVSAKASNGDVIRVPGVMPVTRPVLSRALGQSARWGRLDRRGDLIAIDPPNEVAEQIAGMAGEWPFPPLSAVIGTPTLRPDGTVLVAEGYDRATGLVLLAPPPMPAIPPALSKSQASEALALLGALLTEFPFADEASRSVALSMLMTPVLRGALFPPVPLHAGTAPSAGTGKSYLNDLASAIAAGERCAVIAVAPNPEETEKRLISAVLAGYPIIALDNCNGELAGDFLCQASERPVLQLRPLGSSAVVRVPNTVTVFANGNNLVVVADLVRRTLVCRLDANMENPEERIFRTDPVRLVLVDRGRYVSAILTIARAYIAAGKPDLLPPVPSYQGWSDLVRSPLVWLGCSDPAATISTARAEDPQRQVRAAVFGAWAVEIGLAPAVFRTADLIELAEEVDANGRRKRPHLRTALLDVARARQDRGLDPIRLGQWLKRSENAIAAGYKLTADRSDAARPRWCLSNATA